MPKILVVEDEQHIAEGLKFNLDCEGFETTICSNAEDATGKYTDFDMLILDIMLPGMNGLDFLRQIRKENPQYPVLILSAKTSEESLVEGLSAGADDYIKKPFSLAELILRVNRILERQAWYVEQTAKEQEFSFGDYRINFSTFEARTNDGDVLLTQYECFVMKYLIDNMDRSVSREELLKTVWGYSYTPETRTVDNFIARLRKMFEEDRKSPTHIRSIRGVGYRFYS